MATSGSKTVVVTDWDVLIFSWSLASQSIVNNTSTISWTMSLQASSYGQIESTASKDWSVTVAGTTYSGTNKVGIDANMTKILASGRSVIAHNASGQGSFTYSFSQEFAITFGVESIGTISGSGAGILPVIPRASQPSCITWPEHTQNVGYFGDTISIHMNRASSELTHTVRYAYGSLTGTIATGVTTGTTWTIPLSFMDLIPNAVKGSGTIYVDTYHGSTLVGTKYCGFTAEVSASVVPTVSMTLEDITGTDDIYGSPVQGLSKIKVTINPKLAYSSPIAFYRIWIDGKEYATQSVTTSELTASGNSTVTVWVQDRRSRTAQAEYTMRVQEYAPPKVTALSVHRCDEEGVEDDQGEYIRAVFSAEVASVGSKNTSTYTLRFKKSTESYFTEEVEISDLANTYTVTNWGIILPADSSSSYDIEVEAADRHSSATRATSASTAFTLMNWGSDGTSIAFGKVAEAANTMQIALDVEFIGKVKGTIFDAIYPVGSIYMAYNHTDPSTLFGGTWTRLTGGFLWASQAGDTIGQTGGEKTHTLTEEELPSHNHGGTYTNAGAARTHAWLPSDGSSMGYEAVSVGGGKAHNNMPPYIQVSIWRRTA